MAAHRMVRRGDRVLVGVSGGPDSLVLLSALTALAPEQRLNLRAVYVNHGLRPASARKEAALVRRTGRRWGIPVSVVSRTVRRRKGESLESAARRVRYDALLKLARRFRCGAVAVGHTRDDQAETVLMWILRGTGLAGLAGIPPVRVEGKVRFVRPLLAVSRLEVERFLKEQGIRPLLDRSNLSNRYTRNRIRRGLIPQLEKEYNPQLRRHLAGLAESVRADLEGLEQEAARFWRQAARVRKGSVRLKREILQKAHPALQRVLYRKAVCTLRGHCRGFTRRHWRLLEELAMNGAKGALDLPHQLRAEVRTNA